MTIYADGWASLEDEVSLIDEYWLNGFPVAATSEVAQRRGRGPENRVSPIYDYDDGGIGAVQWLNVTHNAAAVLVSDGGWKDGGTFHLWISNGAGTLPYEVPLRYPVTIEKGDASGWLDRKKQAISVAELVLGLRPLLSRMCE